MNSVLYQSKARTANSSIDNAKTSIDNSITIINSLISRIPNHNGYDALGRNTNESLTSVKNSLSDTTSSFESLKSSIMSKAISEDQKLDLLKDNGDKDGDTNQE